MSKLKGEEGHNEQREQQVRGLSGRNGIRQRVGEEKEGGRV